MTASYVRPDYTGLTALIRSLLNDEAPEVPLTFTDSMLQAPASSAQRSVQAVLARNGVGINRTETIFTVKAGTSIIPFGPTEDDDETANFPTADGHAPPLPPVSAPPAPDPVLPPDLLTVISIMERDPGTNDEWKPVDRIVDEFPTVHTERRLNYWRWTSGEIQFLAATSDRSVKLAYVRALPDFDGSPEPLPIPFSINAIAWKTIVNAEFSRGNTGLLALANAEYATAMNDLLGIVVGDELYEPVRRRPYGTA